jgi:hypothetical protein
VLGGVPTEAAPAFAPKGPAAVADNGFRLPREQTTQLPLSTTTILDLVQARERFVLREHALAQVDQVLK